MGMRSYGGAFAVVSVGLFLIIPSAWAADDETAEAAVTDAARQHLLETIEATRQTDPALANEMERQLDMLDAGELRLSGDQDEALGAPALDGERLGGVGGDGLLVGPPVEGGGLSEHDPRVQQVQSDPRMQEIREAYESGQLTESQALERTFEVLRDHGMEPAEGREWDHEGMTHEGFERAYERMAPEAREQMERLFEHEGERPGMEHEAFERYLESPERSTESPEHELGDRESDMLERSSEIPERYLESPERASEAPERVSEAPEHDVQPPEFEQEQQYEPPPQP